LGHWTGFLCLDENQILRVRIGPELAFAHWEAIGVEQIGRDIGTLLAAQLAGAIRRHGFSRMFDERTHGLALPFIEKVIVDERRRIFPPEQVFAMAAGTEGIKGLRPAAGLFS